MRQSSRDEAEQLRAQRHMVKYSESVWAPTCDTEDVMQVGLETLRWFRIQWMLFLSPETEDNS